MVAAAAASVHFLCDRCAWRGDAKYDELVVLLTLEVVQFFGAKGHGDE